MASCTPSPNRGASARWPTSARNPRSDRDTTSPRANRLYGGDPPGSACRRRQAFCSRKPVTNAARPTAGRSKRGLRVGVRPCAGLRGIGRDLPVVVIRDHQQTDVVSQENQRDRNRSRTLRIVKYSITTKLEVFRFNSRKSSGTCRPFVLTADCYRAQLSAPVL